MSEVRDQVVLALSHEIHIDEAHGFPAGYTAEQLADALIAFSASAA